MSTEAMTIIHPALMSLVKGEISAQKQLLDVQSRLLDPKAVREVPAHQQAEYVALLQDTFSDWSEAQATLAECLAAYEGSIEPTNDMLSDSSLKSQDVALLRNYAEKIADRCTRNKVAELAKDWSVYHKEPHAAQNAEGFWDSFVEMYHKKLPVATPGRMADFKKTFLRNALDELDSIAQACQEQGSDAELYSRLILKPYTSDSQYFVWDESKSQYVGPMSRGSVRRFFQQACPTIAMLHPVTHTPQSNKEQTLLYSSGSMRSFEGLCDLVMKSIKHVRYVAGRSYKNSYDAESDTLQLVVAPFRNDLTPEYDAQIQNWLELMGGSQAGSLLDWLATFRMLERPTCAIYLQGRSESGKSMLADGLAKLFESCRKVSYEQMLSDFNEGLHQSFLISADEGMSTKGHRRMSSSIFRNLITSQELEINAKHSAKNTIQGCVRLIISANNDEGLSMVRESLSESDVQAISGRILLIHPEDNMEKATEYLAELGGRNTTQSWVMGAKLAKHVLWLEANRTVDTRGRLLVSGSANDGSSRLVLKNQREELLDVMAKELLGGREIPWLKVSKGECRVTGPELTAAYRMYNDKLVISRNTLVATLKTFGGYTSKNKMNVGGELRDCHTFAASVLQEHIQTYEMTSPTRLKILFG